MNVERLQPGLWLAGAVGALAAFGWLQFKAPAPLLAPARVSTEERVRTAGLDGPGVSARRQIECDTDEPVKTQAWIIGAPQRHGRVLVWLHGLGDNRAAALLLERHTRHLGMPLLAIDLRAHGDSEGDRLTWGIREKTDVSACLDVFGWYAGTPVRALILGIGYGGLVALHAAADDPRVRAFAVIDPLGGLPDSAGPLLGNAPSFWVGYMTRRAGRIGGFDPEATRPESLMPLLAAKPGLFIESNDNPPEKHALLDRLLGNKPGAKRHAVLPEVSRTQIIVKFGTDVMAQLHPFVKVVDWGPEPVVVANPATATPLSAAPAP
jgi:uncharacterized protein